MSKWQESKWQEVEVMKNIHKIQSGIRQQVIDEICEIAKKHDIDKVVLFGSRAREQYQKKSDIDLAVWGTNVVDFALDIDEQTSTLLLYDVVDFNLPIQEELVKEIEKDGVLLYEKIYELSR